jgi:hypothetical protein
MEESLPAVANFKCGTLTQSPGQKKRMWKSLKQIITHEKLLPWRETDVTCKLNTDKKFSNRNTI